MMRSNSDGHGQPPARAARTALAVVVAVAVLAAILAEAWLLRRGQDRLDAGFGDRGIVATEIVDTGYGGIAEFGPAVTGPDGTIVAGGSIGFDFAVIRLTGNGRADPRFDHDGVVRTPVNGIGRVSGLALQPDGAILAVGTAVSFTPAAPPRLVLVRYASDGDLDSSFGRAGVAELAGWSGPAAVALARDGAIVVAGTGLAQFTAAGMRDAGFGNRGVADVTGSGLSAVTTDDNGRIVVAGGILARFTQDGRLDATFGAGGVADSRGLGMLNAIAMAPDGGVLVGGDVLARYTADGQLEARFGDGGRVAGFGPVHAIAVGLDGRVVIGGTVEAEGGRFALGRYGADGTPDAGFGSAGVVLTDVGGRTGGIRALALQPDGSIVAAGYAWSQSCGIFGCGGSASRLLLARYDGR